MEKWYHKQNYREVAIVADEPLCLPVLFCVVDVDPTDDPEWDERLVVGLADLVLLQGRIIIAIATWKLRRFIFCYQSQI